VILVGHSYGVSVAAQMASEADANYKSVVLMSPIADPKEVKKDKVIKALRAMKPTYPAVEKIAPKKYQHLLTSPTELVGLEKDLETMSDSWSKIRSKIILINGDKDKRVSYRNIQFINEKVDQGNLPEVKILANQGHSIPKSGNLEVRDIFLREVGTDDKNISLSSSRKTAVKLIPKSSVKRCETLFGQIFKTARP